MLLEQFVFRWKLIEGNSVNLSFKSINLLYENVYDVPYHFAKPKSWIAIDEDKNIQPDFESYEGNNS